MAARGVGQPIGSAANVVGSPIPSAERIRRWRAVAESLRSDDVALREARATGGGL